MSEDEEVICKGKDLYTHLVNQGYSDFGTFDSTPAKSEQFNSSHIDFANTLETIIENHPNYLPQKSITISYNDYEQLKIILKSKLMFKEDVDLIGTAIENSFIYKTRPMSKWFWHISTLAGFISSLTLSKKGIVFYLPCGFTFMTAIYSLWNIYKEAFEVRKCKRLSCHIDLLHNLCSDVQKLLRFLKEAEVLSGGRVKSQNVCSGVYMPVQCHSKPVNELYIAPSWETQPHLRKCLLDSLTDVIKILDFACNVLKPKGLSSHDVLGSNDSLNETRKFRDNADPDKCISLKELQKLNESYLILQSEYLKLISFNICPELLNSFLKMKDNTVEFYKLYQGLESKLSDISFRLKMQYNVNSIYTQTNGRVGSRYLIANSNELSSLQIEVHNMFLLMLSMLLRVRNVEDYLENISSNILMEEQNEIKVIMSKQFNSVKDDLTSTSKCYDLIYQQLIGIKNHDIGFRPMKENEIISTASSTTRRTGISVGASDFNVNSPDEVFLAISGLYNEEQEPNLDDWYFEKQPQIPKNLLSELSYRLKARKQYFSEREKAALERQGMLDFPEKLGERSDYGRKADKTLATKKQNIERCLDVSDSSDTEESCAMKMPYQRIKKNRSYHVDSDSDGSANDNERLSKDGSTDRMPEVSYANRSLANLAAMKSQLWGNTSEECFSDG